MQLRAFTIRLIVLLPALLLLPLPTLAEEPAQQKLPTPGTRVQSIFTGFGPEGVSSGGGYNGYANPHVSVAISPNTRYILKKIDGDLRFIDLRTGKPVGKPMEIIGAIKATYMLVPFFSDRLLIMTFFKRIQGRRPTDPQWRAWEVPSGKPVKIDIPAEATAYNTDTASDTITGISSDGHTLVFHDKKNIVVWDPFAGKQVGKPIPFPGLIKEFTFRDNGRILMAHHNRKDLYMWDLESGKRIGRVRLAPGSHKGWWGSRYYRSPDEQVMAGVLTTGNPGLPRYTLQLLRGSGKRIGKPIEFPQIEAVRHVAFGAENRYMGLGLQLGVSPSRVDPRRVDWRPVQIWDLKRGKLLHKLALPEKTILAARALCFSPDGRFLIASYKDPDRFDRSQLVHSKLICWEVETGKVAWGPMKHDHFVKRILFNKEGTHFTTCTDPMEHPAWSGFHGTMTGYAQRFKMPNVETSPGEEKEKP